MTDFCRFIKAGVCAALIALPPAAALAANALQDPLFGLRYNPATVHFEPAPQTVVTACGAALSNEHWSRELYLFGQTTAGDEAFYVLGGRYLPRAEAGHKSGKTLNDTQGAMVLIRADTCTLLGPARESFDSRPPEITAEQLNALGQDAVQRYRQAFAGPAALAQRLSRARVNVPPGHPLATAQDAQ